MTFYTVSSYQQTFHFKNSKCTFMCVIIKLNSPYHYTSKICNTYLKVHFFLNITKYINSATTTWKTTVIIVAHLKALKVLLVIIKTTMFSSSFSYNDCITLECATTCSFSRKSISISTKFYRQRVSQHSICGIYGYCFINYTFSD